MCHLAHVYAVAIEQTVLYALVERSAAAIGVLELDLFFYGIKRARSAHGIQIGLKDLSRMSMEELTDRPFIACSL